ncbi:hypothetical protein [Microbacterium sp. 179-I 3D4 NHS]|uniref:hypothetical protein n=1 Tax=Microbacterium sp. 179-I 3D4 NHS TaxID=3142381 RepID=UPI0039A14C10
MSHAGESSIDARVRAVEQEYARRQTRLFVRFALIEGALLLLGAVLVFGFEVVDPDIGVWFLLGVALVGGFLLSMLLVRHVQARQTARARARGDNPLF